jgi:hypothetical protein
MPREKLLGEKHFVKELKEQLQESKEPKEKVFAVFCNRHGISMDECKKYYDQLASKGEIKEE